MEQVVQFFQDDPATAKVLLNGTGVMGTGAHSVTEREDHLDSTIAIVAAHPWMGRSLGGVTEAIAGLSGTRPMNFEESKYFEGQSVFGEVAAASGIPGMVPFLCFVLITTVAPLRLANRTNPHEAAWLRALVIALVFEWAILQFNQNILRVYLWVHIAVLSTAYAAVSRRQNLGVCELFTADAQKEMSQDILPA
jgi:O-antigen ligase